MSIARTERGALRRVDPPIPASPPALRPPSAAGAKAPLAHYSTLDRLLRAWVARATQGVSPVAASEAISDWAFHLAVSPGKQFELMQKAAAASARLWHWSQYGAAGLKREPPAQAT